MNPEQSNLTLTRTKSRPTDTLARISTHLTTHSIIDPGPPPDGGFRAWSQVFCAWLAIVNSWGFVNSFGAFQPYYETMLPENASTVSWIGSLQACLLFGLGIFSGRALDRGWFRPTVALGIVVQLIGIFTMSAAHSYWQLLLTQGFCTGIGGGIFFVPIMGVCATYFAKNKGMALGIVTSGTAGGGVLYPLVVRQLLPTVGFGWTVRVVGFMNVVSLAICIAFMRPRLPVSSKPSTRNISSHSTAEEGRTLDRLGCLHGRTILLTGAGHVLFNATCVLRLLLCKLSSLCIRCSL
jgi:MFS family permease